MLRIDFNQRFLDHRSILVFVRKLGAVTESEFSELFEDISQLRTVQLPNGRTFHLRYTRHISEEFIDWGSFHMHKKLLGILSVARLLDDNISTVKTAHENLKAWVGNTALHSRCFILGCENTSEDKRDREFVFLNKDNIMKEIEKQVADYALALFLVLESKRMDKSLEKPEKFAFLRSPLDGEMSNDADSRNRKQCIGRMKKYIADLCLVTGVPEEALFHYTVAIEFLRSVGDVLWMAGSTEGLCAASLLCQAEHKLISPERRSLQLDVSQLSTAGPANGTGSDGDEYKVGSVIPLTDGEIIEKSEEIFQVYEKQRKSKVLAIEARFKYARFFLSKKIYREVSTTLQDIFAIEQTFKLSDAEKIQLYSAMAIMYEDIGYMRKAAFFTRKAAQQCTLKGLPRQGWTASYNLMRNAFGGYKIHFDNSSTAGKETGWPGLKIQLMKELIEMSKELQNTNIPIRHISYLIQTMHQHIDENGMQELINSLEKLAASNPQEQFSLVDNLVLGSNEFLPPVALTELPIVRDMKVNVLASHLRPIVSPSSPSPVKTPFIFSTLHKGPRKSKKANPVVRWVEGDVGEVSMQVYNPMPFDIKITKMTLLTEGVPFQAFPSCLALSNDHMSHPFMLLGIPEGSGELAIKGYSVELFGIQSNCSVTETILDKQFSPPLLVNVTPKLPLVQFQCGISDVKSFINSSHRGSSLTLEVKIYRGQSISGPIIVENVGKIPVENFTMTLLSTFSADKLNLVTLNEDHVIQSLPLQTGATSQFHLTFHGLLPDSLQDGGILNWTGKLKISYSGGDAWKLGMSRQAAVDIRIEVISSLHAVNYSFMSVNKGDGEKFEICMDVYNQTDYDVEWRFQMNTGIAYPEEDNTLTAGSSIRTTLELEKFDLSGSDEKRTECDLCTEKLLDLVKLRWKISKFGIFGVLDLDGLKLTEEMVNIVRKNQLRFEMSVNDVKINKGDTVSNVASKLLFLTVTIHNTSDKEVKSSILNIEPFEIDKDGRENFDVKQKICWFGATSTLLPAMQAKSKREHSCGLLFLSPGKFCVNVKCFERVNTNGDQPFRDRTHVIKESPSNRRSRSSRTDSFSDSLLLRQRSQSTPLAQFFHSLLINVQEDPDTIVEEIDAGVDPRISGKDLQKAEESSVANTGLIATESKTTVSVENVGIKEKEDSILERDSSEPVKDDDNKESTVIEIENRGEIIAVKEPVLEDRKVGACNVANTAKVEISGEIIMDSKFHSVHVDHTCSDPENTSIEHNKISFKTQEKELPNIVESLVNKPTTQAIIDVEDIDIDVQDEETVDRNVCQGTTLQEIESNFRENCLSDKETGSEEFEVKIKPTVKNKIRTDELISQEKSSKEETTHVERTDVSVDEELHETVSSPSVKQRILFFNST